MLTEEEFNEFDKLKSFSIGIQRPQPPVAEKIKDNKASEAKKKKRPVGEGNVKYIAGAKAMHIRTGMFQIMTGSFEIKVKAGT